MPTAAAESRLNQDPPAEFKTGHGGARPGAGRKPKQGQAVTADRPAAEPAAEIKSPEPQPTEPPAGRPHPPRSDLAEVRAAATAGWDVPEAVKRKAVFDCAAILADADAGGRLKMTAVRTLAALDRLNQTLAASATAGLAPLPPDLEALIVRVYGDPLDDRSADQPAAAAD